MKKQLRTLIIALAAILVLAGVLVILRLADKNSPADNSSTPAASYTILDEDEDEVVSYEINNKSGSFTILTNEDDELYIEEYNGFPQSLSNYTILEGIVCSTSAYKIEKANLTEYGLDNPKGSVKITFSDGKTEKVYVGNTAEFASAGGYYVRKDGDDSVYVLSQAVGDVILARKVQYLDLIITKYSADKLTDVLDSAEFEGRDINPFSVESTTVSYDGKTKGKALQIAHPYDIHLDEDKSESILSLLFNLYADDVEQLGYEKSDLDKYGLSNPVLKYKLNYDGNQSITVSVGDLSKDGYYYVINHGVNIIFKVEKSKLSKVVGITPEKLIGDYAIVKSINTMKNITITTGGKTYSYEITHEKDKNNVKSVKLNGTTEIDTDSFKNFYAYVVGCDVASVTTDIQKGTLLYKMEYKYKDGTADTYEYYDMGERKYKAVKNDTYAYMFQGKEIRQLNDAVNKIIKGETVGSPIE